MKPSLILFSTLTFCFPAMSQVSILVGFSASQGLGYHSGLVTMLQAERSRLCTSAFVSTADKYLGNGYSYGSNTHLRFGNRIWAGPALSISHTSTSQWDKTSMRPGAAVGIRHRNLQAWIVTHLWDTSPNRIRGVSGTVQGNFGRLIVAPSFDWFTFNQGRGWGVKLMAGWRLSNRGSQ